ncbi:valine--tRNA ligase [Aestuariibius sp. 2305UL40-4]|uniref:valine--tRNA ligase n=1 Tax=Aestuariibius violaceus TaxID=3234132 RepID=UPI00345E16F3
MPLEKTFNAAEAEPRIADAWEAAGAFKAGANAKPGADPFCILLPPPNVTGFLHAGHAFNHTLMDILTRWHRMRGDNTLWQPGLDHAGIATQLVVERQLKEQGNIRRQDMSREDFLAKVWEWKATSGGGIVEQDRRLGASMDWSREAFTMRGAPGDPEPDHGPNFHDAVIKVFVDMYEKGLIYRGKRLVNWDPHFETAISDLEVENKEVAGHMWHFKYPLAGGETYTYVEKDADGNTLFEEVRDYISIATTRPETMLGDGAVAVHPSDERYAPIVGKLCEIPVGPKKHRRLIPIITDDYPDPDFGSGAVKITGAHDFNDYEVAKRGGIPMYRLMDTKGHMRDDGAPYAEAAEIALSVARGERDLTEAEADTLNLVPDDLRGLDRFEAREKVVDQITSEGLAVMVPETDPRLGRRMGGSAQGAGSPIAPEEGGETRELLPLVEAKPIMQPFGDRSKVVIEPMLTDQWFVDTKKIVGPALDAVRDGTVRIIPESGEKTYYHWLENIEPWTISRQLWWGHQIPVWFGPNFERQSDGNLNRMPDREFCASHFENAKQEAAQFYSELFPNAEILVEELLDDPEPTWPITEEDYAKFRKMMRGTSLETLYEHQRVEQSRKWQLKVDNDPTNDVTTITVRVRRDPDVLDTWFSSGLWPIGTLGWPDTDDPAYKTYFPTSVLITGSDILFFWVARMMMMQYAVVGERPFDTVYLHGLVRDAKGQKMSKTLGNVVDPIELIDKYGADAVRFNNAAIATQTGTIRLDEKRIEGYRNFTTKIWNAFRFAEMNEVFADRSVPSDQMPTKSRPDAAPSESVNKWILGELDEAREEVDRCLNDYRFNDAANHLYGFVWGRVCDWYIEFSKPLLQGDDPAKREETQRVMAEVLETCLILLHPFMPFVTEELWAQTGNRAKMLATTDWPQPAATKDETAATELSWVITLIENIRSARKQLNVPDRLDVPLVRVESDPAGQAAWAQNESLIKRMAKIADLTDGPAPKGAITIPAPGATFAMPVADLIDVAAEKARLDKALQKLGKEIGGLEGRLKNPKFAESAPPEVVEETQENLRARQEEQAKLKDARDRLDEIESS